LVVGVVHPGAVLTVGAIVGAIELYTAAPRAWSRYDLRRARTAGHHVAAALARLAIVTAGETAAATP